MTASVRYKPLELFIHILTWTLVFGFPLVFVDRESGFSWSKFIGHSIVPVGYFVVFYTNYFFLIPKALLNNKIRNFFILNFLLIVIVTIAVHTLWNIMTPPPPGQHYGPPAYYFYIRDLVMMVFVVGLSITVRLSKRWRTLEKRLIQSEQQKTDAELKNLKNQLNPHFLLNTLNNIYALIAFDSDKAQESVQELSKLLRYMLYEDQTDWIPLTREFDFIKNYVSLMKIRLAENVKVELALTEEIGSHIQIAPFLFISLIENAFKHGVSSTEHSFINISITGYANGNVKCEIVNSNFPKSNVDKSGSGIGLEQLQRRLDLIYPHQYEWKRGDNKKQVYTSVLQIETNHKLER